MLIADDDAGVRETLVEFLERRGYQTAVAVDGTSAVQALLRQPADVVLWTLAHGAFDYLLKPVDFLHLAQSIEMATVMNALDADIGGSSSRSAAGEASAPDAPPER